MKKLILIFSLVLGITSISVKAQKGKELIIGANGAITGVFIMNQNFYGEPEVDYAPKMGYTASFNLGYNFSENLGMMSEVQYSLQGQKYEGKQSFEGNVYDVERNIDLRYLNIPLLFKFSSGTKMMRFRFYVGPQVGILLDATQDYKRNGSKAGTTAMDNDGETFITDANDIKERIEKYDFGFVGDVGADLHVTKDIYLTAGLRGNYGFRDINKRQYRIEDLDGEYMPSHNVWGGLYFGIHYKIDVQGYNQRSF
jgi:hypothetical protein